jgi:acyl-CoA synthetase (NDP forming)
VATDTELAKALFRPSAVALVGASGDADKNTARPQRYLQQHGYAGRIVPINRHRDEVLGLQAWPTLSDAPGPIEHAFVMVPAPAVVEVIRDCARAGVKVASIYSNGFAESGEPGARRQREVLDVAREHGVRVLGPNSMGVVDTHAKTPITVNAALELPRLAAGTLGVITQSGTVLGTLISRGQARGLGFSRLISVGNEADLGVAEVGELLVDDEYTEAILLFLETVRDPAALARMARRALTARKPVIVYKLGRSHAGRAMAVSHSAAIAGPDAAATAFFRAHGMLRVDMLETLLELPPMVAGRQPPQGRRVAVLTTTGGGSAMVVDRLGGLGIETLPAPQGLVERLAGLGVDVADGPVVDLTMAGANRRAYGAALEELVNAEDCDMVVAVVGSSAQFHPQTAVEPIVTYANSAKPVAAFLVPQADESLDYLGKAGIAAFRTPEACADGVRAYLDWRVPQAEVTGKTDLAELASLLRDLRGHVDLPSAGKAFAALGIPQAQACVISNPDAGSPIGYPVALKALSPDLAHLTDAGAVALDVTDGEAMRTAAENIRSAVAATYPHARLEGFLVQRMETGIAEVLLGYRDNPETGPVVVLGAGGIVAEVYSDVATRLAPVDLATAQEMIDEVPGLAAVRGYRSQPPGDRDALAAAVQAFSELARITQPRVLEAEINPLLIKHEGIVAVDALLVLAE